MYKIITACCLALLSTHALATLGQRTAEQMQSAYDATAANCGSSDAIPAHACSGVLLRATKPSPTYHSWHHSPNSKAKGGVSFSYLRADIPTRQLAADARSGFTLYPLLKRPKDTLHYKVLCATPTDGDTWTRDQQGCGDNSNTAETEAACHLQGVLTAEQWIERFRASGDYKRQCAFDVRKERKAERAEAFLQSLRAKQLYASELPFPWNEVIIGAWDEEGSNRLPIQSFFYIDGQYNALAQAQADQKDWFATYGAFIPVIRIRLPGGGQSAATFSYHEAEQAVASADSVSAAGTP